MTIGEPEVAQIERRNSVETSVNVSDELPRLSDLKPTKSLLTLLDDCHNHVYANEGLLKDRIFHEIVKILVMKLLDESQTREDGRTRVAVTAEEYRRILSKEDRTFMERMGRAFETAKAEFPSVFRSDETLTLSPLTLAYIVRQLQYVSLTETPTDVKGDAFQTFVYKHQRGDRGEFFTPHPVLKLAAKIVNPEAEERVLDPACGSAGFLLEATTCVADTHETRKKAWDIGAYVRTRIRGVEFNPDIARAAMLRMAFEGGTGREITCANALQLNPESFGTFHVILTNPPFGSKGKIEDPDITSTFDLGYRWSKTKDGTFRKTKELLKGQTPEVLFIELCIRMLRPSGRMAIVVPEGLLQNSSSEYVRNWIRSRAEIIGVISLPQETFIPYGTGIKTSLLVVRKHPTSSASRCFMACVTKVGYDVKGQTVFKRTADGTLILDSNGKPIVDEDVTAIGESFRDFSKNIQMNETNQVFTIPRRKLGSRLDVQHYIPCDSRSLDQLRTSGAKRLGDVASVVSEMDGFRAQGDAEIRYVEISDVDSNTLQIVSVQRLRAHEAPSRARYRLQKGDIITAVSGASTGTSNHATAYVTEFDDGAICSNGFAVLRGFRDIEPAFLLAYMRTEVFLRQVRRMMTGHAIPCISADDLREILVPIPPREVQEQIAENVTNLLRLRREANDIGRAIADQASDALRNTLS